MFVKYEMLPNRLQQIIGLYPLMIDVEKFYRTRKMILPSFRRDRDVVVGRILWWIAGVNGLMGVRWVWRRLTGWICGRVLLGFWRVGMSFWTRCVDSSETGLRQMFVLMTERICHRKNVVFGWKNAEVRSLKLWYHDETDVYIYTNQCVYMFKAVGRNG